MELPDLNDVRMFAAVGREGTLSAAARELGLPVSTVSRSLTRLEKHLNVLLVQRGPRGLVMTDSGKDYMQVCRRALQTLRDGGVVMERRREHPSGVIRVACPVTMTRLTFAPLIGLFLERYPDLQVALEPYASGWNREADSDVDVYFKVRAPKDSLRRVRLYPGAKRGLFASREYVERNGAPSTPEEIAHHACVGSGTWKLCRGSRTVVLHPSFRVEISDPLAQVEMACRGVGIVVLPLYMGRNSAYGRGLVPVLSQWRAEPISLCALFSGQARLTPKVKVLLDFLGEYIGTERDPRLRGMGARGLFTDAGASGITAE